ncbi:hypothetical protein [Melittangium boletus]|uniref:Lipoprotein MlpA n=1 Tax=Melittangium boletus DSM 14713 TaxID=1294270 RepID=A0A250II94_9BACT|nr:hypothetical protein [Melittangium boletus]ATB31534.1 hypothetical protein MEBOL_004997 [Melittangium boletus DSM 14713]
MSKRISMAMAVLGAVGTLAGCNLAQPASGCFVQDSANWQAKYVLKDPSLSGLSCGQYKGESMGVFKYTNPDASEQEVAENRSSRVAIRPDRLAALYAASYQVDSGKVDKDGKPILTTVTVPRAEVNQDPSNATGLSTTLAQEPNDDGLCLATGFNTARVEAPAAYKKTEHGSGLIVGAETISYSYENIEVYSAPSSPGTQLRGTVRITDNNCTAEYEVWALWPARACDPAAPISATNCGSAQNINPDFDVVCDPDIKRCVPAKAPPSFKNQ